MNFLDLCNRKLKTKVITSPNILNCKFEAITKMPSLSSDSLRSSALNSCRQILASISSSNGSSLTKDEVENAFQSAEFAAAVFKLFDHNAQGALRVEELIETVKDNLKE